MRFFGSGTADGVMSKMTWNVVGCDTTVPDQMTTNVSPVNWERMPFVSLSEIVLTDRPVKAGSVNDIKKDMRPNGAATSVTMSCVPAKFAVMRLVLFWAPNSIAGSAIVTIVPASFR